MEKPLGPIIVLAALAIWRSLMAAESPGDWVYRVPNKTVAFIQRHFQETK